VTPDNGVEAIEEGVTEGGGLERGVEDAVPLILLTVEDAGVANDLDLFENLRGVDELLGLEVDAVGIVLTVKGSIRT
jgi:hypothetical protein